MPGEDDEWTFVPSSKPRRGGRRAGGGNNYQNQQQHRQRRRPQEEGEERLRLARNLERGRRAAEFLSHDDSNVVCVDGSGSADDHIRLLRETITECMDSLEDQFRSGRGFFFNLIQGLRAATAGGGGGCDEETNEDEDDRPSLEENDDDRGGIEIREIVAYGIGNFAGASSRRDRSPPALQLACLLLLRRHAASAYSVAAVAPAAVAADSSPSRVKRSEGEENGAEVSPARRGHGGGDDDNDGGATNAIATPPMSFEDEQRCVPISYFEPLVLPIERRLLKDTFRVCVLDVNERGKRRVTPAAAAPRQWERRLRLERRCPTLFYMPHCPMRLYGNVLWANWDPRILAGDNNGNGNSGGDAIFFGNSFVSYDERTISGEKRNDPTNGVIRISPFVRETRVGLFNGGGGDDDTEKEKKKKKGSASMRNCLHRNGDEVLENLEAAFNDCAVTTFSSRGSNGETWPDRPKEYLGSNDYLEIDEVL